MSFSNQKKFLTPRQALERLKKYCAYQERSHSEVRSKLLDVGLRGKDLEMVMVQLIEEGFLNEERFAIAFTRGKFRMKRWGRKKIEQELKARKISSYCIQKAMKEIDGADYRASLQKLLKKKLSSLHDKNPFTKKQKLAAFLIRKGYEQEMVWQMVNEEVNFSA